MSIEITDDQKGMARNCIIIKNHCNTIDVDVEEVKELFNSLSDEQVKQLAEERGFTVVLASTSYPPEGFLKGSIFDANTNIPKD